MRPIVASWRDNIVHYFIYFFPIGSFTWGTNYVDIFLWWARFGGAMKYTIKIIIKDFTKTHKDNGLNQSLVLNLVFILLANDWKLNSSRLFLGIKTLSMALKKMLLRNTSINVPIEMNSKIVWIESALNMKKSVNDGTVWRSNIYDENTQTLRSNYSLLIRSFLMLFCSHSQIFTHISLLILFYLPVPLCRSLRLFIHVFWISFRFIILITLATNSHNRLFSAFTKKKPIWRNIKIIHNRADMHSSDG